MPYFETMTAETARLWRAKGRRYLEDLLAADGPLTGRVGGLGREAAQAIVGGMSDGDVDKAMGSIADSEDNEVPSMLPSFHAVTFGRRHSDICLIAARELLLEWAVARGLTAVGEVVHQTSDYGRFCGYAMEFTGEPHEPTSETRLKAPPRRGQQWLTDHEEWYELPD